MRTLHLRCGDDLRDRLPAAGWDGDYQSFVDPLWQGPAWDDGDRLGLLMRRARFIAAEYGIACAGVYRRLHAEYTALENAHRFDRIVLWCEHDVYDQIALIRILHAFARTDVPVFAIPADGTHHFGTMTDAGLAALRGSEKRIDAAQIAAGSACWQAFSAFENPDALRALCRHALPWPHLGAALMRLLEEIPAADGLARSERTVLLALAERTDSLPGIMRAAHRADPVFCISDQALLATLRRLENTLVQRGGDTWHITPAGAAVLAGARYTPRLPHWVGGFASGR